ncbi:MAG: cadherin repeat domain-containing protein [Planctomycetaceae bacterium]|nr:cadherin repeat domain-containing protein [Planctomycetaceae bacterium]
MTGPKTTVAASLDFESRASHSLVVRVSDRDDATLTDEAIVAIYVNDVAEPGLMITTPIKAGATSVSLAILSDSLFDATTDLNIADLQLRMGDVQLSPKSRGKKGPVVSYTDVNGDGRLDLVVTFEVTSGSFAEQTDAEITLQGSLTNGSLFSSYSSVDILPGKGNGRGKK